MSASERANRLLGWVVNQTDSPIVKEMNDMGLRGSEDSLVWNYRVIRKMVEGVECFGVHEVYYGDDGAPRFCTENRIAPFGNSKGDLAIELGLMIRSLGEEVLDYEIFRQNEDDLEDVFERFPDEEEDYDEGLDDD